MAKKKGKKGLEKKLLAEDEIVVLEAAHFAMRKFPELLKNEMDLSDEEYDRVFNNLDTSLNRDVAV